MKYISTLVSLVALVTPGLTQINLRTAATFGALSVTGITNVGLSIVTGDMGSSGAALTGFPPGIATGTTGLGTPATIQGRADAVTAFNEGSELTGTNPVNTALSGATLLPGVYTYSSSVGLTGTLTLDAAGNTSAIWVFQIGTTITTAAASTIVLINGGSACNVFWLLGTSGTLGAASEFSGNILADVSISLTAGASVDGRLYAGAAITLIDNAINFGNCGAPVVVATTSTTSTTTASSTLTTSTLSSTCPITTATVTRTVTDQKAASTVTKTVTVTRF